MRFLKSCYRVSLDAWWEFLKDDGWAIASHIALSALMSLFPFFLVLTAVAGMIGSADLASESARLVLETWPEEVAGPIATEIQHVLDGAQQGVLTIGALLALYFASSGVESLRIGLNRAYSVIDTRPAWLLRVESIGYVIVGLIAILALSFLVLLAPLIIRTATRFVPALREVEDTFLFIRLTVASVLIIVPLFVVHKWLPAGRRRLRDILPGILATLALWLVAGIAFGRYLADFAFTYSIYYAGLATPIIALVFLYLTACIFIYGGELNSIIIENRRKVEDSPG